MTIPWRPTARLFFLPAALLAGLPGAGAEDAWAQTGVLELVIMDETTGDPIEGAVVRLADRAPTVTTDASGRCQIADLPGGNWKIDIHAIGYEPRFETIRVAAGQTARKRFGLAFTGEKLPDVVVEARRAKLEPRYADFYRRMKVGNGYFTTWEQLKQRAYTSVGEALRGVRGVYVFCRTHDCYISMSRSKGCSPTYWIDGFEQPTFNSSTPVQDIYGLEVYRGSAEMPAEFVGTSGCGAIVIWTKNRPYR